MAVNDFARWNLLREISCNRQTGTLVMQLGQRYVSWCFLEGNLGWIHSTTPEYTLTQFLLQHRKLEKPRLDEARTKLDDSLSLGASLMKEGAATTSMLQDWTAQHATWLAPLLLQTSVHLFWADRLLPVKPEFVHHPGVPFSCVLLGCDRNSVEIRTAFQFLDEMPRIYRVHDPEGLTAWMNVNERRLIPYLLRCDPIEHILCDPELDRLTCCRALFLLWISGRLNRVTKAPVEQQGASTSWLERARQVPPDWIIPLAIGMLLGVILRPAPEPPPATTPASIQQPALPPAAWAAPPPTHQTSHDSE